MCSSLHVQNNLPDDEHKMFETCRKQEELNYNISLISAFCLLTLHDTLYLVQSILPSDTLWCTVRHSVIISTL